VRLGDRSTFDSSPLWEGVRVSVPVMTRIVAPEVLGAYEVPAGVPIFLALGRYDCGVPYHWWENARAHLSTCTTACTTGARTTRRTRSRTSSPRTSSSGPDAAGVPGASI